MALKRINIDLDEETTLKILEKLGFLEDMKVKPFIEKVLKEYAEENDVEIIVKKAAKATKKK